MFSVGREDVKGTEAYKMKVVRKNGDVNFVYLDPDHYLEIRTVSQRTEQGAQIETETDLGDYEKIAGVFIPFSIESGQRNSSDKQKLLHYRKGPNRTSRSMTLFSSSRRRPPKSRTALDMPAAVLKNGTIETSSRVSCVLF